MNKKLKLTIKGGTPNIAANTLYLTKTYDICDSDPTDIIQNFVKIFCKEEMELLVSEEDKKANGDPVQVLIFKNLDQCQKPTILLLMVEEFESDNSYGKYYQYPEILEQYLDLENGFK